MFSVSNTVIQLLKPRFLTNVLTFQPNQWVWGLNSSYKNTHIYIPDRLHVQDRSKEKNKRDKIYSDCLKNISLLIPFEILPFSHGRNR